MSSLCGWSKVQWNFVSAAKSRGGGEIVDQ
jgi:hypothetical protein